VMIATHATSQKWKKDIAEDRDRGRKGHLIKIHVAFQDDFINLYACSFIWLWIKHGACFARGIPHLKNNLRLSWPVLFVVVWIFIILWMFWGKFWENMY
jgi:hypothetical protein